MFEQESNRFAAVQDILLHHVLVKRIPMPDQFARGMEASGLGIIDIIKQYPEQCQELFAQTDENTISYAKVKEATQLFTPKDDIEKDLKDMFERFLLECSVEGLFKNRVETM